MLFFFFFFFFNSNITINFHVHSNVFPVFKYLNTEIERIRGRYLISHPKKFCEEFIFDFISFPQMNIKATRQLLFMNFIFFIIVTTKKNQVLKTPKRWCPRWSKVEIFSDEKFNGDIFFI